jgi:D-alanyl-D-alanine carboxypeptidase
MSGNISTARDMAKLFHACWKLPLFIKIIQAKERLIEIKYVDNQGNLQINSVALKTTNKMNNYNRFCKGGKTG